MFNVQEEVFVVLRSANWGQLRIPRFPADIFYTDTICYSSQEILGNVTATTIRSMGPYSLSPVLMNSE